MEYSDDKKKKLMELLKNNPPKQVCGKNVKEIKSSDGYKFIIDDNSWLILRLSGTEPILRVYAEASSEKIANSYLDFGKNLALSM
jgi:phosphomannomutase